MYRIFNIALDSQIPIPELSTADDSTAAKTFTFSLGGQDQSVNSNINWFHDWFDANGNVSVSAGSLGNIYWLRYLGMVDFEINLNEQSIVAYKHPSTPDNTIRHILLDQVIPRMLGQQGQFILHAGAVRLSNSKTVALIGQSGWGKSTLVSSLQQQGAELITDDCLMIKLGSGSVSAVPNYFGLRLFDDSINAIYGQQQEADSVAHYSNKKRLILCGDSHTNAAALNLDAIFLLNKPVAVRKSDEVTVTTAGGMDVMMALVAQIFMLDIADKPLLARQFKYASALLESDVRCFQLDYPRDHGFLIEVRMAIEQAIK
ncbi:MAG: hypothetical protein ACQ9ET_02385 [Nitrosomonadaceae bacterium]